MVNQGEPLFKPTACMQASSQGWLPTAIQNTFYKSSPVQSNFRVELLRAPEMLGDYYFKRTKKPADFSNCLVGKNFRHVRVLTSILKYSPKK